VLSFIFIPCFNIAIMLNLSSSQLRQAADLKEKIEALNTELAALFGGTTLVLAAAAVEEVQAPEPVEAEESARPAKRTISPAHKAALRAAQALRWAKHNAAKAKTAPKVAKKGGMSAAGRARIAAAQKARWAKAKAGKVAEAPAKSETKPAKRKMSEAGRAAIAAAAKARWAKYNAAKK
jgi:hypothetical protein